MNDGQNEFPSKPPKRFITLQDPCILDCPTEDFLITLTMDRADPRFLFIAIEGDMRKCIDFSEEVLLFTSRNEAFRFLEKVRDSEFFLELIAEEQALNQGWEAL